MPSAAAICLCLNLIGVAVSVEALVAAPSNALRSGVCLWLILINGGLAVWNGWRLVSP